jgi:hypothetical protein
VPHEAPHRQRVRHFAGSPKKRADPGPERATIAAAKCRNRTAGSSHLRAL